MNILFAAALSAIITAGTGGPADTSSTYVNPILNADYSDPDVIRTEDDYWMTASSFNHVPGLQILHSADLVHWKIVNAALPRMTPEEDFALPSHGNGVWAPSIRCHDGIFRIFWGDPDRGIYCITAEDPAGEWSRPHLVIEGRGMIDPCPLWDDDGRVWLVHGWAGSRAGFKSVLSVRELAPDCSRAIGEEILIFDGKHNGNPTVEGPKFYKRDGWYYIFAPAGVSRKAGSSSSAPAVSPALTSTVKYCIRAALTSTVPTRAHGSRTPKAATGSCISRTATPTAG